LESYAQQINLAASHTNLGVVTGEHKRRSNSTMSKRRAEAIGAVAKEEQK
jgi:hypothetical protein